MESSLDEMKGEYEMIKAEKEKKASQKFQGKMLMAFVSGLEFLKMLFYSSTSTLYIMCLNSNVAKIPLNRNKFRTITSAS